MKKENKMRISYCVIFDSKRSRAVSKTRAKKFQDVLYAAGVALPLPIVPYFTVRHLEIYDAEDTHAGFCIFKKGVVK